MTILFDTYVAMSGPHNVMLRCHACSHNVMTCYDVMHARITSCYDVMHARITPWLVTMSGSHNVMLWCHACSHTISLQFVIEIMNVMMRYRASMTWHDIHGWRPLHFDETICVIPYETEQRGSSDGYHFSYSLVFVFWLATQYYFRRK